MNLSKAHRKIAVEQASKAVEKQMLKEINNGLALQMELIMLLVLHDKFGFGQKRASAALLEFEEMWDSVGKRYLTLDDIEQVVKDELGIIINGDDMATQKLEVKKKVS